MKSHVVSAPGDRCGQGETHIQPSAAACPSGIGPGKQSVILSVWEVAWDTPRPWCPALGGTGSVRSAEAGAQAQGGS